MTITEIDEKFMRCGHQGREFGVRRRVTVQLTPITRASDHPTCAHHDGTDGHLAKRCRPPRLGQCLAHEPCVGFANILLFILLHRAPFSHACMGPRANANAKRTPRPRQEHGGETGIRTPETLARLTVFKTAAFNRSAISPYPAMIASQRPDAGCGRASANGASPSSRRPPTQLALLRRCRVDTLREPVRHAL